MTADRSVETLGPVLENEPDSPLTHRGIQFTPEEQEHVAAFIEGALLRHHARQAFSGQAS